MAASIISRRPPSVTNHESRTTNKPVMTLPFHVVVRFIHESRITNHELVGIVYTLSCRGEAKSRIP